MRLYRSVVLAALAAVLALPVAASALPTELRSPTSGTAVITYDPVSLVTGAITTAPTVGVYDLGLYRSFTCEIANNNDAGAGNRVITPICYADKLATKQTYSYPTITVNANANGRYVFDPVTSAASADTGVVDSPNVPCRFLKMSASAVAGTGLISCTARRW